MAGETDLTGDFYVRLLGLRSPRLILELVIETEDDREDFERRWCGAPVAQQGIRLQAREPNGDLLAGALDRRIVEALTASFLPMLIVPPDSVGAMIGRLRGTSLWSQRLTVRFPNGTVDEGYRALLGVAAFHAHAELQGYFMLKDRLKPEAIIL
jgi:hypothetical protein